MKGPHLMQETQELVLTVPILWKEKLRHRGDSNQTESEQRQTQAQVCLGPKRWTHSPISLCFIWWLLDADSEDFRHSGLLTACWMNGSLNEHSSSHYIIEHILFWAFLWAETGLSWSRNLGYPAPAGPTGAAHMQMGHPWWFWGGLFSMKAKDLLVQGNHPPFLWSTLSQTPCLLFEYRRKTLEA